MNMYKTFLMISCYILMGPFIEIQDQVGAWDQTFWQLLHSIVKDMDHYELYSTTILPIMISSGHD